MLKVALLFLNLLVQFKQHLLQCSCFLESFSDCYATVIHLNFYVCSVCRNCYHPLIDGKRNSDGEYWHHSQVLNSKYLIAVVSRCQFVKEMPLFCIVPYLFLTIKKKMGILWSILVVVWVLVLFFFFFFLLHLHLTAILLLPWAAELSCTWVFLLSEKRKELLLIICVLTGWENSRRSCQSRAAWTCSQSACKT